MISSYKRVTAAWCLVSGGGLELARPVKVLARSISALRSLRSSVSVVDLGNACKKSGAANLTPEVLVSCFPLFEVVRPSLYYLASTVLSSDLRSFALLLQPLGVAKETNRYLGMQPACGFPLPLAYSICRLEDSAEDHLGGTSGWRTPIASFLSYLPTFQRLLLVCFYLE